MFFQADVLQCIAVSLLFMQVLLLLLKSERRLYLTLMVLTPAIAFLTPVVWGIDFWPILPKFFAGYMNGTHFQNFPGFPFFPWSAFLFAGAIVGYFYLQAKDAAARPEPVLNQAIMMKRSLWWAAAIIVLSFLIEPLAASLYPTYDYWRFSPSFYMLRLGLVMFLCSGMFFYERKPGVSSRSPITLIGRESLIVYTTHLLLIYGDLYTFNFFKRVNHSFGYGEALLATVLLMVLMYALALFWSNLKRGSPRWKMAFQFGTLAVLIGVFFFGPGG
jgi:peptidoglycan/LPS O-acetylase OafA/YrhL